MKYKEEDEAAMDNPWANGILTGHLEDVDNPANWPEFYFRPTFGKKGEYEGHKLIIGAKPVPLNNEGEGIQHEWEFHYQG
eukprot:14839066-Ditylum_brightwellii.AAC.1